ncbi:MAG: hypothetical protein P8L85_07620 [Rubripirellula sp.]|nr:hypothetical protein [Rubripirellula sp.]
MACLPTKGVESLHLESLVRIGAAAGVYEEKSADHNRESGLQRPENRVERRIYAVKLILEIELSKMEDEPEQKQGLPEEKRRLAAETPSVAFESIKPDQSKGPMDVIHAA